LTKRSKRSKALTTAMNSSLNLPESKPKEKELTPLQKRVREREKEVAESGVKICQKCGGVLWDCGKCGDCGPWKITGGI